MNNIIIGGFILPLAMTEIIELVGARLLSVKTGADYLLIVLTNIVTNLSLNLVILTIGINYMKPLDFIVVLFLEAIVVLIEWRIYKRFMVYDGNKLRISILLNILSFAGGLIWGIGI